MKYEITVKLCMRSYPSIFRVSMLCCFTLNTLPLSLQYRYIFCAQCTLLVLSGPEKSNIGRLGCTKRSYQTALQQI